jgi:hypothetical protein
LEEEFYLQKESLSTEDLEALNRAIYGWRHSFKESFGMHGFNLKYPYFEVEIHWTQEIKYLSSVRHMNAIRGEAALGVARNVGSRGNGKKVDRFVMTRLALYNLSNSMIEKMSQPQKKQKTDSICAMKSCKWQSISLASAYKTILREQMEFLGIQWTSPSLIRYFSGIHFLRHRFYSAKKPAFLFQTPKGTLCAELLDVFQIEACDVVWLLVAPFIVQEQVANMNLLRRQGGVSHPFGSHS